MLRMDDYRPFRRCAILCPMKIQYDPHASDSSTPSAYYQAEPAAVLCPLLTPSSFCVFSAFGGPVLFGGNFCPPLNPSSGPKQYQNPPERYKKPPKGTERYRSPQLGVFLGPVKLTFKPLIRNVLTPALSFVLGAFVSSRFSGVPAEIPLIQLRT